MTFDLDLDLDLGLTNIFENKTSVSKICEFKNVTKKVLQSHAENSQLVE